MAVKSPSASRIHIRKKRHGDPRHDIGAERSAPHEGIDRPRVDPERHRQREPESTGERGGDGAVAERAEQRAG